MPTLKLHNWFKKDFSAFVKLCDEGRKFDKATNKVSFTGLIFNDIKEIAVSGVKPPSSISNSLIPIAVRNTLFDQKLPIGFSEDNFLSLLEENLRSSVGKNSQYVLLTGFYAKGNFPRKVYKLPNAIISIYKGTDQNSRGVKRFVQKQKERLGSVDQYSDPVEFPYHQHYVKVFVTARSIDEALEKASNNFAAFRGVLNYLANYTRYSATSWGVNQEKKVFNFFVPFRFSTLHTPTGMLLGGSYYQKHWQAPHKPFDLTTQKMFFPNLEKTIRIFRKGHGLSDDAWEVLAAYSRALDTPGYQAAFVKLWAVLELLCCVENNESHEKIVSRCSFLYSDYQETRLMLNHLRERRNKLIHSMEEEELSSEEKLIYQLNRYATYVLKQWIYNPFKFLDKNEFKDFLDSPNDVNLLKRKRYVADLAISFIVPKH